MSCTLILGFEMQTGWRLWLQSWLMSYLALWLAGLPAIAKRHGQSMDPILLLLIIFNIVAVLPILAVLAIIAILAVLAVLLLTRHGANWLFLLTCYKLKQIAQLKLWTYLFLCQSIYNAVTFNPIY